MNINATLFGQMITFALFVWFTMKFVWPPIHKALDERQAKIADGLAAAERGHHDLALAQKDATKRIHAAKDEASALLDTARRQVEKLIEDGKSQAALEAKRIKEHAQEEVMQMERATREKLRMQVASLAVAGAEKILSRTVNENEHAEILEQLVKEL